MIDARTLTAVAAAIADTCGANALAYKSYAGNHETWQWVARRAIVELEAHGYAIERPQDIGLDDSEVDDDES